MRNSAIWVYAASMSICAVACFNNSASDSNHFGPCNPAPCLTIQMGEIPESSLSELSSEARAKVLSTINSLVLEHADQLGDDIPSSGEEEGLKERLLAKFEEELGSGGETSAAWEFVRETRVLFQNEYTITFEVSNRGYLGGAHEFNEIALLSFDRASGGKISLETIVAPYSRDVLASIAGIEFRRAYSIPIGKSLEEAGFTTPKEGVFPVTENIGILADGLVLHYNPYEIAPYAKGAFRFTIPFDAIEPLLRTTGGGEERIRKYFSKMSSANSSELFKSSENQPAN